MSGPSSAERVFTPFTGMKSNDPLNLFAAPDCDALGNAIEDTMIPLRLPPLEALPCTNVCSNPARLPCGKCKLVSYCSQKCEREHKSVHKRSCNVLLGPVVIKDSADSRDDDQCSSNSHRIHEEVAKLDTLPSGNLPGVDIINLKNNEKEKTRDLSVAFVASGDLRSVIRTVNALGSDYTGRLHILINDASKVIVSRNIVLLLLLGAMPNEAVAADIALHFWYSAFLPEAHRLRIIAALVLVLKHTDKTEPLSINLGRRAKLTCLVPQDITDCLLYTAGPTLSMARARDEYERVTSARLDTRNRELALAGLRPCHSLAFMAFWRSGAILPFSIDSDHHTAPNSSLFSPSGVLLQNSSVMNPLASWDINETVKSGQAYGAQPEDVFGCLYFYLSDQLRTFAKRIRELDVTFLVFNSNAQTLAKDISSGEYAAHNLTSRFRFDRIDLGDALADAGSMRDTLSLWAPFLAQGETAAILGVFPDWTRSQKDGSVASADDAVVVPIVDKLLKLGRLPPGTTLADARASAMASLDAAYDNSKAFSRFLKASSLSHVLRETTLKRRLRHRILPQRVKTSVDAKASDLPHLPDDESWYRYVKLAKVSFRARYLELTHATA